MSGRFKFISRPIIGREFVSAFVGVLGFHHVGVYDEECDEVLDLGYDEDGCIEIKVTSLAEFEQDEKVEVELLSGTGSESEVEERWLKVISAWDLDEFSGVQFDPFGKQGINCELLAYWVLTGREQTPQGDAAEDLVGEVIVESLNWLVSLFK
jgi:hypothetical protein